MIIDTHCHYNLEPLADDVKNYWKKAQEEGVEGAIIIGTNIENSKLALKLASNFSNMYAAIGLHPSNYTQSIKTILDGDKYSQEEIDNLIDNNFAELSKILNKELKTNSNLVGIGEIGLDYYRLKNKGLKRKLVTEMQKKMFAKQLELAFKNNLPATIHVRDQNDRFENKNNAYFETLEIIKKVLENTSQTDLNSTPKFILHCVSGPMDYIKEAIALGAYVGVAGNITYENSEHLRDIVKNIPENKILLETDAPYLPPKLSSNGKALDNQICEPQMIKITANFLQQKLGFNLDIIKDNTNKLFYGKFN